MFTDNEKIELAGLLAAAMKENNLGKITRTQIIEAGETTKRNKVTTDLSADLQREMSELLADVARTFLAGKYNTDLMKDMKPKGIHQTRDNLTSEDFGRK